MMENVETVWSYFLQYGNLFLFIIVFLEYMNLPGLPAGIIMPAAGILVAENGTNFALAWGLSIIAGLLGSWVLFLIGFGLEKVVLERLCEKWPKLRGSMDKTTLYMDKYGPRGVFVARLIPVVRTIISFAAGMFRVNFIKFTLYSIPGIAIWNGVLILAGFIFGKALIGL